MITAHHMRHAIGKKVGNDVGGHDLDESVHVVEHVGRWNCDVVDEFVYGVVKVVWCYGQLGLFCCFITVKLTQTDHLLAWCVGRRGGGD